MSNYRDKLEVQLLRCPKAVQSEVASLRNRVEHLEERVRLALGDSKESLMWAESYESNASGGHGSVRHYFDSGFTFYAKGPSGAVTMRATGDTDADRAVRVASDDGTIVIHPCAANVVHIEVRS